MTAFPLPEHEHDHHHCMAHALEAAQAQCAAAGLRLTPLRRKVLELVWRTHAPVGAYALLDALQADSQTPIAPPTIYRALDFLLACGLIHKIEARNGYIGCAHPSDPTHPAQFLICTSCGAVAELVDPQMTAALLKGAERLGFVVTRPSVEIEGLCARCQKAEAEERSSGAV